MIRATAHDPAPRRIVVCIDYTQAEQHGARRTAHGWRLPDGRHVLSVRTIANGGGRGLTAAGLDLLPGVELTPAQLAELVPALLTAPRPTIRAHAGGPSW